MLTFFPNAPLHSYAIAPPLNNSQIDGRFQDISCLRRPYLKGASKSEKMATQCSSDNTEMIKTVYSFALSDKTKHNKFRPEVFLGKNGSV